MNNNINEELFDHDISIEEFDHITDGVEDHVFSESYLKRKETIMNNATHKANISKLGVKIAAAASVIAIVAPFAVNAATGGDLFDRLWGNTGKENVESYSFLYTEEGKIDVNGNVATYPIDMPMPSLTTDSTVTVVSPTVHTTGSVVILSPIRR